MNLISRNKKKFFIIFFLFMVTVPCFAEGSWIDAPFIAAWNYFLNMDRKWILLALKIGKIMAVLGIVWSCIQMAFGTMEGRKLIVSTITKFCMFFLILTLYPVFITQLQNFAVQAGVLLDNGLPEKANTAIQTFYDKISNKVLIENSDNAIALKALNEQIINLRTQMNKQIEESLEYSNPDIVHDEAENTYGSTIKELEAQKKALESRDPSNAQKLLNAMKEVFIAPDGKQKNFKSNITRKKDYKVNTPLKYVRPGNKTGESSVSAISSDNDVFYFDYVSPSALLKLIYVSSLIIWETEWEVVNAEWQANLDKAEEEAGFIKKKILKAVPISEFPVHRIFEIIFCLILICIMVLTGCFAMIQYIQGLLEYTIVSWGSAILVPMLLFDGTQDIAQRIISTLLQQTIKLLFCVLMINMFIYFYFDLLTVCLASQDGFSMQNFIYGAFISLIGVSFMLNAPKLASALMTGTPQMSMGEFVQVAGAIAGGARLAGNAANKSVSLAKGAGHLAHTGIQKGANHAGSIAGQIGAYKGASEVARQRAMEQGKGKGTASLYGAGAGMAAMLKESASQKKQWAMDKANSFISGNGNSRGGGTSGSGTKWSYEGGSPDVDAKTGKSNATSLGQSRDENGITKTFGQHISDRYSAAKEKAANSQNGKSSAKSVSALDTRMNKLNEQERWNNTEHNLNRSTTPVLDRQNSSYFKNQIQQHNNLNNADVAKGSSSSTVKFTGQLPERIKVNSTTTKNDKYVRKHNDKTKKH